MCFCKQYLFNILVLEKCTHSFSIAVFQFFQNWLKQYFLIGSKYKNATRHKLWISNLYKYGNQWRKWKYDIIMRLIYSNLIGILILDVSISNSNMIIFIYSNLSFVYLLKIQLIFDAFYVNREFMLSVLLSNFKRDSRILNC